MRGIVLTGATSMLGIALVKQCLEYEVPVLALCRPDTCRRYRLPDSALVRVLDSDLAGLADVPTLSEEYDIFYHVAWAHTDKAGRYSPTLQERNIAHTLEAVALAKRLGCRRFVGVGSQAEYGRVDSVIRPDTPAHPESAYGIAKYAAGMLSKIACAHSGMEHLWVRVFSVYGANDNNGTLVSTCVEKFAKGEQVPLTKGEQIWDYLHEDDAGRALFLLGEKGLPGKTYCLGSGEGHPLRVYLEIIRDVINPAMPPLVFGAAPYAEGQVMYLCADVSDVKIDVGWAPRLSFRQGIERLRDRGRS